MTKLCECGCGQPAPISKNTDTLRGYVAGQPRRFVTGHNAKLKATPETFWAKVERRGPVECWPWTGSRMKHGYGRAPYQGFLWGAHRLAYTLTNGPIPDGLQVLHRCDNPPCCNPAHLFLGTNADNMADMHRKGRQRKQETYKRGPVKTHCIHGHELTPDNIKLTNGGTGRRCLTCYLAGKKKKKP